MRTRRAPEDLLEGLRFGAAPFDVGDLQPRLVLAVEDLEQAIEERARETVEEAWILPHGDRLAPGLDGLGVTAEPGAGMARAACQRGYSVRFLFQRREPART